MKRKFTEVKKLFLFGLFGMFMAGMAQASEKQIDLQNYFNLDSIYFQKDKNESAKKEERDFTFYWSGPWRSSYHFDRTAVKKEHTNESNGIWGFGIQTGKNAEFYWKRCINSPGHLANWVGINWRLYNSKYFEGGIEGFLVDGYPQNNYLFAPGLAGTVKFKLKNFNFNIHLPPPKTYTTEMLGLKSLESLDVVIFDLGYQTKF